MKEINMKNANAMGRLTLELEAVQAKSSVRNIEPKDIVEWLEYIQTHLGISKKALNGVKVEVDIHAQDFPAAYKYQPVSTHFCAIFKNGSWRVTNITRSRCGRIRCQIYHTEDSRKAIQQRFDSIK